ncbi:MAG TPA: energy transducer TonB [Chitinophagaceae bacterium]|jgi:TonB family protein
MKPFFLLVCTITFSCKLFASDTLVFRISNPRWPEKDLNGRYIRKVVQTADSGFLALDYSDSKLAAIGYYNDTDFTISLYCHYYYNIDKGFPQEIKCYDSVGNLKLHAELNKNGDTIWRQTLKDEVVIGSSIFPEYESERTIFFSMQKPAVYPGGSSSWKKFISSNMRYPKEAIKKKIQGVVIVEFMVSQEGKITDAEVVQSASALLDSEALRLIRCSPNWIPAEENGNKVNFRQRQSVIFKL